MYNYIGTEESDILTENSNGHAFSQDESIGTFKGWNLLKRIDLLIPAGKNTIARMSLDEFEIDIVSLGNCTYGGRANIVLDRFGDLVSRLSLKRESEQMRHTL